MPGGVLRRLFELAGVVPLGVFVLVHVASYATALFGRSSFGAAERGSVLALAAEVVCVWLPLAFHAVYGAWLGFGRLESDVSVRRRTVLLRVTGIFALVFIALHAAWLRLPLLLGERGPEDVQQMLAAGLSETFQGVPLTAALHIAGLGVVLFHLALGLPRFIEKWGLGEAVVARRAAAIACAALFALGVATVVQFATGSAMPLRLHVGP